MKQIFIIIILCIFVIGCAKKEQYNIKELERMAEEDMVIEISKKQLEYHQSLH